MLTPPGKVVGTYTMMDQNQTKHGVKFGGKSDIRDYPGISHLTYLGLRGVVVVVVVGARAAHVVVAGAASALLADMNPSCTTSVDLGFRVFNICQIWLEISPKFH